MILFFDTETTGFPVKGRPANSPEQPHLVQLGAYLTDTQGRPLAQLEFLIKPDGWIIPDDAAAIHGFTTAHCEAHGMKLEMALKAFNMLCRKAEKVIAFNMDFDSQIMNIAYNRQKLENRMDSLEQLCAMKPCVPICKVPFPSGKGGWKWPKLKEAHKHFFGEEFDGQHSALADTQAAAKVWFELVRLGVVK